MSGRRVFARTATDISLLTPASGQTGYHSPAPYHRLHAHPHHATLQTHESDGTLVATGSQRSTFDEEVGQDPFTAETDAALVVGYLTPHKVAILILIEYYCREMHDSSSNSKAALALLTFLVKRIKDPNEYIQPGLKDLLKAVTEIHENGKDIEQFLISTLQRIRSPYHLEVFMLGKPPNKNDDDDQERPFGLADLIMWPESEVPGKLAPSSVLGVYVRKAQMAFRRLAFEEVCRLYTTFETFVAELDADRQEGPQDSIRYSGARSIFDAEKYLDAKVTEMTKTRDLDIPQELLEHVYGIHRRMPLLAKSDYIMCLYAQETADFETAVGSLHRFFDYCMSHDRTLYQYALLNLAMLHARFGHYGPALLAIRETIEIARDNLDDECLSYARSWLNRLTMAAPDARDHSSESRTLAALAAKTDRPSFHYLQSLSELTKSKHLLGTSVAQSIEALIKGTSIGLKHSLDDVGGMAQLYQSKVWGLYGNPALSSLYSQLQQTYRPTETDIGDVAAGYTKHATDLAQQGHFREAIRALEQAKQKFPLSTIRSIPWIQTLAQILQRQALASRRLKDAEIWISSMATTLRNKDILSSSSTNSSLESHAGSTPGPKAEHHPQQQQQQQRQQRHAPGRTGYRPETTLPTTNKPQRSVPNQRGDPSTHGHNSGREGGDGFMANGTPGITTSAPKPMAIDQDEASVELQLEILLQRALFSAATAQRTEAVEILSRGMDAARMYQAVWPAGMQRYSVLYMLALAELYMEASGGYGGGGMTGYAQQHQQQGGHHRTSVSMAIPLLLTTMTLSEQRCQRALFFLSTLRLAEALLHLGAIDQAAHLVEGIMTQVLAQADLFTRATAFFQYAKCLLAQLAHIVDNESDENKSPEDERNEGGRKRGAGGVEDPKTRHLTEVLHLLQRAIEGFQQLDAVEEVQQVLYFMIRCHYELRQDQMVAAKIRLFRELGQQVQKDMQQHRPPSWFAYYYLRHDLSEVLTSTEPSSS
ncbi:anaphase promoting complex subunit 5 [Actinomortierella wolfii]|nr:anaphase promoting complex subunit 5 [Actinomortierella wolfii]